jgi:hypothetical protein
VNASNFGVAISVVAVGGMGTAATINHTADFVEIEAFYTEGGFTRSMMGVGL